MLKAHFFARITLLYFLSLIAQPIAVQAVPVPAIAQQSLYLPLLSGKRVGLVINQTSEWQGRSLLDMLLDTQVAVKTVFVPEHGFRGKADAGAHIDNGTDPASGLPVISLYGKNKKPSAAQMKGLDVLVYDLQDVGVRFYTYISTLQYVMEACAEYGVSLIVLDRPNPNGHLIDGPILDTAFRSFVGMQAIPVLYGMSCGEYARMLQGERWFPLAEKLDLKVIPCNFYRHSDPYELPVAPSPNLKTMTAVYLYPGLCFFEGTGVSVGRGTDKPFQQWGHPDFAGKTEYSFVPQSREGAQSPVLVSKKCYGKLVAEDAGAAYRLSRKGLDLSSLITAYSWSKDKEHFFNDFFDKLAGTAQLRAQIIQGKREAEIRSSWLPGLARFRQIRKKYLLYAD